MLNQDVFSSFDCEEYVVSYSSNGYYDESSLLQLIYTADEAYVGKLGQLLVGSAGADGIEFCYRMGKKGLWAFYPYEDQFEFKADTIAELVKGYLEGTICV